MPAISLVQGKTFMIDAMLEPIIALGLVRNVVQLVDFTAKGLRRGSEHMRTQDLFDHTRLTSITSDL